MPPSMSTRPRARAPIAAILAVFAALAAGFALSACGSSGSPADAAATERAKERQDETKAADFAKCLREHGIEASASSAGGQFRLQISPKAGTGRQTMETAQKACARYRPEPKRIKLSPQERVKREEEVLKFAKCMREHGVDIHAEVGGGKVRMGIHRAEGPNPESPAFQSAQKACAGDLPFKLGRAPGPLGKPPGRAGGEGAGTSSSGSGNRAGFAIGG
jgi:hypothetical protein